jgi:superfamily II DNA/RNA helicase
MPCFEKSFWQFERTTCAPLKTRTCLGGTSAWPSKNERSLNVGFQSPLSKSKLASWEDYASKFKTKYPSLLDFFQLLENWYVGLKLLVVTWEEEEPLTMSWLASSDALTVFPDFNPALKKFLQIEKLASNAMNFMKLNCLCEQLLEKKDKFGISFRCIVFVQQRISAYILAYFISHTERLNQIGLRAGYVAAKGSRITPSIELSSSQSEETFDRFRKGHIDVLVATSVAEEASHNLCIVKTFDAALTHPHLCTLLLQGIDVPAANVVISYNHMKDSVELCQREGRARQTDCAFVVMEQRPDRPVSKLRKVKECQDNIIRTFDPSNVKQRRGHDIQAQKHREASAHEILTRADHNYVSLLNLYRQKTKAHLEECHSYTPAGKRVVTVKYSSVMRTSVEAEGVGLSKKEAKQAAARALLKLLKAMNTSSRT